MAASVFFRNGFFSVAEIQDAHHLLEPLLGASIAPIAFAIALLASGQSSTITGTLAGQIVMEGYLNLRIRPWLRRLITRSLAVIPAVAVIGYYGENSTGAMLVLSQVVLSLQLPFAIIPLINSVADKRRMGEFSISRSIQVLAWIVAGIILSLNVKLVIDQISTWVSEAGSRAWTIEITVIPVAIYLALLLVYVTLHPWLRGRQVRFHLPEIVGVHRQPVQDAALLQEPAPYKHIAVALDFAGKDEKLLTESLRFIDKSQTQLTLLHVVESPVAHTLGAEGEDQETLADKERLEKLAQTMQTNGVVTNWQLGNGEPVSELAKMINALNVEMVVVGGHGHSGVSDLIHGTVISDLRHHIQASVVIVPMSESAVPSVNLQSKILST
jgi:manganese transport protein